jgi:phosphate transport system substrate-binding protein
MKLVCHVMASCMMILSMCAGAKAETLTIPGAGNPEYVLGQLAHAFNSSQSQHKVVVPETVGTAGALRAIADETATLARVGRPLKESERTGGIIYSPLGRDPVVFAAGSGVAVGPVTMAQMLDVYSGRLTNWQELGGSPGAIRAIGREVTDSSSLTIGQAVKAFLDMNLYEGVKVVHLDSQMIALLDRFPTSLGFLNRSALSAAKTKLVLLVLDSMELNAESIESGRYPFIMEFGLIYKEGSLTEAGREFMQFIKSPEGERVLRMHGVVPAAPVQSAARAGQ